MRTRSETAGAMVAARVTPTEHEGIERVARANDRTLSREIRRAIRYYLSHLDAAEIDLKAEAESAVERAGSAT